MILIGFRSRFSQCVNYMRFIVHCSSSVIWCNSLVSLNTLRPRQNGRHFADDTFNRIFVNENVRISIKFSLKFVPKGPINNIPALVQIMAWRRPGDKPLSEPLMVSLLTYICVTRPQWDKMIMEFLSVPRNITLRWIVVEIKDITFAILVMTMNFSWFFPGKMRLYSRINKSNSYQG